MTKNKRISRRRFIGCVGAGATALQLGPRFVHAAEATSVKKVHVIFKTHLDIGFTNLAANVVATYINEFIPAAIRLARETRRQHGDKRFKWTTGSWLIHTFLEQADNKNRRDMEQAIEANDICWHALPFTTLSETLDASLFEAGLQLSKRLDERFGRNTISAKMTDVPGHTRSIVPLLQNAGVNLLHIGVNPASMPPDVPPVFMWQSTDASRVAVMYQKDYGGIMQIPNTSEAVAIMFTGDNHGPQTVEQVVDAYRNIQAQYPDATIVASDLNEVANTINSISKTLPVVTSELGDSWIHGIGSDPLRIAQLRELSRLRREWLSAGTLAKDSDTDLAFSIPLCMVGEHTWGMDVKTHLQSWDIYTPEALAKARTTEPFKRIEASWQEKRQYIQNAVQSLPDNLKAVARKALDKLKPCLPEFNKFKGMEEPGMIVETPFLSFALDPNTGALAHLQNRKTGRSWASTDNLMALSSYQTFSQEDYSHFMDQYLTGRPDWALKDFGKPGIEAFNPCSCTWLPRLKSAWQMEEDTWLTVLADLKIVDEKGHAIPGCPQQITTEYKIHKTKPLLDITLQWFGKQANRLPEALWFSFTPATNKDGNWMLDKMGQDVDPRDVVKNGGHKLHAIGKHIQYSDKQDSMTIGSLDAPLVAPEDRTLLNFDNVIPEPEKGMHFCLFNNVWGTNSAMWFDDDMRFRFELEC